MGSPFVHPGTILNGRGRLNRFVCFVTSFLTIACYIEHSDPKHDEHDEHGNVGATSTQNVKSNESQRQRFQCSKFVLPSLGRAFEVGIVRCGLACRTKALRFIFGGKFLPRIVSDSHGILSHGNAWSQ